MGRAFEQLFSPRGWVFERSNLQKFKCPGVVEVSNLLMHYCMDIINKLSLYFYLSILLFTVPYFSMCLLSLIALV